MLVEVVVMMTVVVILAMVEVIIVLVVAMCIVLRNAKYDVVAQQCKVLE